MNGDIGMSECIVRMEMPKSCWDCPCLDDYGDYPVCEISNEQRGYNFPIHEKRMPNCPIICQLPEGHGRLVDMRDIEQMEASTLDKQDEYFVGWNDAIKICQTAPTIIPAERSET